MGAITLRMRATVRIDPMDDTRSSAIEVCKQMPQARQ